MNIFRYLKSDENHLQESLWDVTVNFTEWTQDHAFESVKQSIASINAHIEKKNSLLVSTFRGDDRMGDIVEKWDDYTKQLHELIDNLVMIHVDEPGFEQLLIRLSQNVDNMIRFCRGEMYPAVRELVSEDDLANINRRLDQMVLS